MSFCARALSPGPLHLQGRPPRAPAAASHGQGETGVGGRGAGGVVGGAILQGDHAPTTTRGVRRLHPPPLVSSWFFSLGRGPGGRGGRGGARPGVNPGAGAVQPARGKNWRARAHLRQAQRRPAQRRRGRPRSPARHAPRRARRGRRGRGRRVAPLGGLRLVPAAAHDKCSRGNPPRPRIYPGAPPARPRALPAPISLGRGPSSSGPLRRERLGPHETHKAKRENLFLRDAERLGTLLRPSGPGEESSPRRRRRATPSVWAEP